VQLYICDDEVDELVEKLMRITDAITETEVVRQALEGALEPQHKQPSLNDGIRPLQARVAALGPVDPDFDMKAFTDDL
jgi:antitoxin VapB